MSRRFTRSITQPIVATSEAELQMHIQNALRNSRKPVIVTDNSADSNHAAHHMTTHLNDHSAVYANDSSLSYGAHKVVSAPLDHHYSGNEANYEVIHKKSNEVVQHTQNITLKYLKPPPLAPPGDLVIRQESDVQLPAAPPLIIREPAEPPAPARPIVIREEPPRKPPHLPREEITIPGRTLPAPPRQRIVEKLPQIPAPPPPVLIERWLGYPEQTRQVRFIPGRKLAPLAAPKNLLIKWDSPSVQVRHQLNYTGVTIADPDQYRAKHGSNLVPSHMLPPIANEFVKNVPAGEVLGVHSSTRKPRLVGDVRALSLLNATKYHGNNTKTHSNSYFQNQSGYATASLSLPQQPISEPIISDLSASEYVEEANVLAETSGAAYTTTSHTEGAVAAESNFMFEEQNNPFFQQVEEAVSSDEFEN